MIKDFLLVRAAPHVLHDTIWHYLEFKHAPLALSVPALANEFRRYTMNHLLPDVAPACNLYQSVPALATVVEHMLGGWEGIQRFSADAEYLSIVRPDEDHMVQHLMDGPPQFVAIDEELVCFSSESHGQVRMFDFVRRPPDVARADFLDALHQDAAWACSNKVYRSAVARRVHSIAGTGAAAFGRDAEGFDAVIEVWVSNGELLQGLREEQQARRTLFCDPARSFTALTHERRILS